MTRQDQTFQPLQERKNERYVYSERELQAALNDIAADPLAVKTIVVAEAINLSKTLTISQVHDGLILRGIGGDSGFQVSPGYSLSAMVAVLPTGTMNLTLESLTFRSTSLTTVGLLYAGVGGSSPATGAHVILRDISFHCAGQSFSLAGEGPFHLENLYIADGDINVSLSAAHRVHAWGCEFNQAMTIDASSFHSWHGNFFFAVTITGTGGFMTFTGNLFNGNFNSAAANAGAGANSVIVGNKSLSGTITVGGNDLAASNA